MQAEPLTNARIIKMSSIPYFVVENCLAARRSDTAIVANTMIVMTTA